MRHVFWVVALLLVGGYAFNAKGLYGDSQKKPQSCELEFGSGSYSWHGCDRGEAVEEVVRYDPTDETFQVYCREIRIQCN